MRVTLFLLTLLIAFSCDQLSNSEKDTIHQYHLVTQKTINLRDSETTKSIKLIDQYIAAYENREHYLKEHLYFAISKLEEFKIRYHKKDTLVEKKMADFLKIYNPGYEISLSSLKFLLYQDTVIYNSWNSFLKEEITHNMASKIPHTCGRFTKVYVNPNQKYITQGEPYKASFFIGYEKYPKYFGDGLSKINNSTSKLKIIPDQSINRDKWEGYCVFEIDTFKIEIPYAIISCNK